MNKKGFTLIELLSVIVILSVILVIAVPRIINTINKAKESSMLTSAKMILNATEKKYEIDQMKENVEKLFGENNENEIVCSSITKINEEDYESCTLQIIDDKIEISLIGKGKFENYTITGNKDNLKIVYGKIVLLYTKVVDSNPGIICGNRNEENYVDNTECHIKSMEDLVAFSNLVNSGSDFSEKTVYLDNSLEVDNKLSYVNTLSTYGDINGDGVIEGIKDELTKEKGFNPIGMSSTYQFKGIFDGNGKTIGKLMINRPTVNYVGLFGYVNTGIIKKLDIENIIVTGKDYVGSIVGNSTTTTTSIIAKNITVTGNNRVGGITGQGHVNTAYLYGENNVTGNEYVGGIAGYRGATNSLIANVNVSAIGCAGGIVGYRASYSTASIIESATVKGSRSDSIGKITCASTTFGSSSSDVILKNGDNIISGISSSNGIEFTSKYKNINYYNSILDTVLGGDNDGDGYYYDYDSNNEIVLRKLSEYPLDTTFDNGSGTKDDPYIIENYNDMKKIAINPTATSYYKLVNDLDYSDANHYIIGIFGSTFAGTFLGNNKKISNLEIYGANYIGLFGSASGAIEKLNIENIIVEGKNYVGSVVGQATGTIKTFNANNITVIGNDNVGGIAGFSSKKVSYVPASNITVTGHNKVGGITGSGDTYNIYLYETNSVNGNEYVGGVSGYGGVNNSLVKSVSVVGNSSVGGLAGYRDGATINSIIEFGTIKSNSVISSIGKVSGSTANYGLSSDQVIIQNGDTIVKGTSGSNGTEFTSKNKNINYYNQYIDTVLGGDNDGDGYYYDYDSNNEIVLRKLSEYPLYTTFDNGSGTEADPYLIETIDDMKKIAINPTATNYYKLVSDLDYTNENYYVIGISDSIFAGTFLGNNKKISNLEIYGADYIGLFGKASGTIKNIKISNIEVVGNNYIGSIAGSSTGTNSNISIQNVNITGNNYLGGVIGSLSTILTNVTLNNITITGNNYLGSGVGNGTASTLHLSGINNITGNEYVGGITGYGGGYNSIVTSVNVTGNTHVGGISGFKWTKSVNSIIESGTISVNTDTTTMGKIHGGSLTSKAGGRCSSNVILKKIDTIITVPTENDGTEFASDKISDLTYYDEILTTENEVSSGGYYFGYDESNNIILKQKN